MPVQYKTSRRTPLVYRLWSKVQKSSSCWRWLGSTTKGYGVIGSGGNESTSLYVHRVALELAMGYPIPPGFIACHDCPDGDDPLCVRNDVSGDHAVNGFIRPKFGHLWLGTPADNITDMIRKGRQSTPEQHASPGEHNGRAKLTEHGVLEIKARYAAGGVTRADLRREFGVTWAVINGVVNGTKWRHVA